MPDHFDMTVFLQYAELFLYWAAGLALHILKKSTRDGISVKHYFASKPVYTIASLCVSIGVCLALVRNGDTSFMSYFGASYMAESLINQFKQKEVPPNEGSTAEGS
jgi:hypothetical protein